MYVLVQDVFNDTISMTAWVWLDIDTFDWVIHLYVSESDVSNACMIHAWWNRSKGHTNGESGLNILSKDVFGTFGDLVTFIAWFWDNGIIEVGNLHSSENDVSSPGVNSISVKREHWNFKGEIT